MHQEQKKLVLTFAQKNSLTPEKIADLTQHYGMNLLIYGGVKPLFKINVKNEKWMKEALSILTKLCQ